MEYSISWILLGILAGGIILINYRYRNKSLGARAALTAVYVLTYVLLLIIFMAIMWNHAADVRERQKWEGYEGAP
jgi:hypothetical protein